MSFLQNPKVLLGVRISQLAIGLGFLILLAYSNANPGYWMGLEGPVALGVVSFLFTLVIGIYGCWVAFKSASHGRAFQIARTVLEALIFLMWIGTATLMLRPQQTNYNAPAIPAPPFVEWDLAIAFSFFEIVSFAITILLEILYMRSGSSGPTASYV